MRALVNWRKAYNTALPHLGFCWGISMIVMVEFLATAFTSSRQVVVADYHNIGSPSLVRVALFRANSDGD
jgi:hypothetical protein